MLTKRSLVLYVYIKFRRLGLPLLIPVRVFWELLDAVDDILLFTGYRIGGMDMRKALDSAADAVREVTKLGTYELVDVQAAGKVSIKIGLW